MAVENYQEQLKKARQETTLSQARSRVATHSREYGILSDRAWARLILEITVNYALIWLALFLLFTLANFLYHIPNGLPAAILGNGTYATHVIDYFRLGQAWVLGLSAFSAGVITFTSCIVENLRALRSPEQA